MTPFDCPRCGVTLTMSDRNGIEIDYCGQCRGVWLDRGELDKILDRATAAAPPPTTSGPAGGWTQPAPAYQPQPAYPPPQAQPGYPPPQHQPGWYPRDDDDDKRRYGHKPRKHWLSELFD